MLALVTLIVLHSLDGREITINTAQITSMHASVPNLQNKLLTNDVHCVIGLTDSKFVSVVEDCETVKQLVEGAK